MSPENAAGEHLAIFRWHRGRPDMSDAEAQLRDLYALEDALSQLKRRVEREAQLERGCACHRRGRR